MLNLRRAGIYAALWNFAGSTFSQFIRFGIGVVLARILSPRDYGLVGMLAIFISIGDALVDSGFSQALIQKKKITDSDLSSIFFLNLFISLIIYFTLWITSPLVANFYKEPFLQQLIVVISFGIIVRSLVIIQNTLFIKELKFKDITKIRVISLVFSAFIAIPMAIYGLGVWSLVGLTLSTDISYSILIWYKSSWRPKPIIRLSSIKVLFGYGSRILGIGILDNSFMHVYKLIIGKYFSAFELGLFTRAYGYRELISKNISMQINSIAFPIFSKMQVESNQLKNNYIKINEFATFITVPLLAVLAFTARPLICVLITEKWLQSVPYLQILCIGGIFYPIYAIQVAVLKAIGMINKYLKMTILGKIAIIISIIIAVRWGVIGLVYSHVCTMIFSFSLGAFYMHKYLHLDIFRQWLDFFKYTFLSLVVFYPIHLLSLTLTNYDVIQIITQISVGLIIYYLLALKLKLQGCIEANRIFNEQILPQIKRRLF